MTQSIRAGSAPVAARELSTHDDRSPSASSDPTVGWRRKASAVALPAAVLCQLVTNVVYAVVSTTSGLTDTGPAATTLLLYSSYPVAVQVSAVGAMLGSLLLVPGLLAAIRVLRPHRPRLALTAISLMIAGYICYFAVAFSLFDTLGLALTHPEATDALDASQEFGGATAVFLIFVAGNLVGTFLLGLSAVLSRGELPRAAGFLVMAWPIGHVIGLIVGSEWVEVSAGSLEFVGFVMIARRVMQLSDAEWTTRG